MPAIWAAAGLDLRDCLITAYQRMSSPQPCQATFLFLPYSAVMLLAATGPTQWVVRNPIEYQKDLQQMAVKLGASPHYLQDCWCWIWNCGYFMLVLVLAQE